MTLTHRRALSKDNVVELLHYDRVGKWCRCVVNLKNGSCESTIHGNDEPILYAVKRYGKNATITFPDNVVMYDRYTSQLMNVESIGVDIPGKVKVIHHQPNNKETGNLIGIAWSDKEHTVVSLCDDTTEDWLARCVINVNLSLLETINVSRACMHHPLEHSWIYRFNRDIFDGDVKSEHSYIITYDEYIDNDYVNNNIIASKADCFTGRGERYGNCSQDQLHGLGSFMTLFNGKLYGKFFGCDDDVVYDVDDIFKLSMDCGFEIENKTHHAITIVAYGHRMEFTFNDDNDVKINNFTESVEN